jgi:hypothetical protein
MPKPHKGMTKKKRKKENSRLLSLMNMSDFIYRKTQNLHQKTAKTDK